MSGIPTGSRPNDGWRSKPITEKQAGFLHDLSCKMFAGMTRGEASDMIARLKSGLTPGQHSYDNDTLEDNK